MARRQTRRQGTVAKDPVKPVRIELPGSGIPFQHQFAGGWDPPSKHYGIPGDSGTDIWRSDTRVPCGSGWISALRSLAQVRFGPTTEADPYETLLKNLENPKMC